MLIQDQWCQQFPSHSIGDLHFGVDGALYVSAGEGASFNGTDYGQAGTPPNFCGDPPNEGGSLRAQDVRTSADPTGLDGAVLRLDPATGQAMANNPFVSSSDANARRIVAYGMRNPFRFTLRPGTNEVWAGDVGADHNEEIDRVIVGAQGSSLPNYGWPCYEGPARHAGFDSLNLSLCETLYAGPGQTAPYFSWTHASTGPAACPAAGGRRSPGSPFTRTGPPTSAGPAQLPRCLSKRVVLRRLRA